jgi:membrane protein YdbS with pleckstrin-like domain
MTPSSPGPDSGPDREADREVASAPSHPPALPDAAEPAAAGHVVAEHADPGHAASERAADAPAGDAVDEAQAAVSELPAVDWDGPEGWQALPRRAYRVFLYVALMVAAIPAGIATLSLAELLLRREGGWIALVAIWAVAVGMALWVAHKRYRFTYWRLDEDGFAVRRGRLWQWETRVPTSRVQHLDLKRGPLERAHGLASLILHTAGTRLSAVSISGLEDADAERLRDHFSRRIDRQEDDDHA